MALTDQPYLPLYVNQWMNNTKLKECGMSAHGLMISIMCIMHKNEDYGVLLLKQKYKQSDNQVRNFAIQIAKLSSFDSLEIEPILKELLDEKVLYIEDEKLICKRMVRDAHISKIRAESGSGGGKKTQSKHKVFAKANEEANTVTVNGNVNGNVNDIGREGLGEKPKPEIPDWETFLTYTREKEPAIDVKDLKHKYGAWIEDDWKDGNGRKITNWKSKVNHTLPHLKKNFQKQTIDENR